MQFVIDELKRTLKYKKRQVEDNVTKIQLNKESIESLEQANERERQAIQQIEQLLEELEAKELAK